MFSSPGDLGLNIISPVSAAKAEDGDKPCIEKSKFIRTLTHERDRRKCRHDLHYYGGRIVEGGRLAGDGSRPIRELDYIGPCTASNKAEEERREAEQTGVTSERRARRGGRKGAQLPGATPSTSCGAG